MLAGLPVVLTLGVATLPSRSVDAAARDRHAALAAIAAGKPGSRWLDDGGEDGARILSLDRCSGADCVTFRTTLWTRAGSRDRRSTAYTCFVDDTATSSRPAFRLMSGWHKLRGAAVTIGMVGFHSAGRTPAEQQNLAAQFLLLRDTQRLPLAAGTPGDCRAVACG